jgi:hypothetical protein
VNVSKTWYPSSILGRSTKIKGENDEGFTSLDSEATVILPVTLKNTFIFTRKITMTIELKIKQKHLALEPNIIRTEERKLKKQMQHNRGEGKYWDLDRKRQELSNHRRWNVRNESRATHLARAFIEGKPYAYVEKKRNDEGLFQLYIVPRIVAMAQRYGKREHRGITADVIKEWSKTGV